MPATSFGRFLTRSLRDGSLLTNKPQATGKRSSFLFANSSPTANHSTLSNALAGRPMPFYKSEWSWAVLVTFIGREQPLGGLFFANSPNHCNDSQRRM